MEARAAALADRFSMRPSGPSTKSLQWRPGQLPWLTIEVQLGNAAGFSASMEARAAALADLMGPADWHAVPVALQWRPGQLPWLTSGSSLIAVIQSPSFNGGQGSCPG